MKKIVISVLIVLTGLLMLNFVFRPAAVTESLPELIIYAYICDENNSGCSYSFQPLTLHEVRQMAPVFGAGMTNLNFMFEFDGGLVEVVSEDEDVQLSKGESHGPWDYQAGYDQRDYGFGFRVASGGYLAANPLGSNRGHITITDPAMMSIKGCTGREYYLTVKAYDFMDEKAPVVTAMLKLVQLEDERGVNGGSNYYSVEMISYEYSDDMKLMEDAP
ncbi:MAG: hypothetical protein IJ493_09060 [Clostridia bacterium]|nr:hypothetical protein [Clostridia bacterium]